jgi:hypothetical protein
MATGNSSTASRQVVDLINIKIFEKQYLENTVQWGEIFSWKVKNALLFFSFHGCINFYGKRRKLDK